MLRSLALALLSVTALAFAACSDDDFGKQGSTADFAVPSDLAPAADMAPTPDGGPPDEALVD